MLQKGWKKAVSCIFLLVAIAAVWFGASYLASSGAVSANTEKTAPPEEESDHFPVRQEWTAPEVMPEESDYHGRLTVGDFDMVIGIDMADMQEMKEVFAAIRSDSAYFETDLNGDGTDELIWTRSRTDSEAAVVIAIFAGGRTGEQRVYWAPEEDADSFCLMGEDTILYIRKNDWIISEYHCTEVLFDQYFDMYAGDGLSMYLVDDYDAYVSDVDAALRRRLSYIGGAGVWYQASRTGQDTNEAVEIGADAWMERFRQMTGKTFAQISPVYESLRTGIETGVSRQVFVAKRTGYPDFPYETIVTYPQLTEGDFVRVINQLLKNEAFSLISHVGEDEQDAEELLNTLIDDLRVTSTQEVNYRVLHDADDMISILYIAKRSGPDEEETRRLSLLTVDKKSGRRVQIGDLTTADRIRESVEAGEAEAFLVTADLKRHADQTKDAAWMGEALTRTRDDADDWKSVGMDEQYVYLAVQEAEDRMPDMLLRVPRWCAGMSSPGHMELLTMHRAYPFLKEVLDDAESLTVRRHTDGFSISYLTADSGRVSAELKESNARVTLFDTPEQARDTYMALYSDVTGFSSGHYPENRADHISYQAAFYAVETYYGESGRAFLEAGDKSYELTQRCSSTRGGFLLRTDAESILQTDGLYRAEYGGSALWQNFRDGSFSVVKQLTEEQTFSFRFTPVREGENAGKSLLEIVPYTEPWNAQRMILDDEFYFFSDLNGDGYEDLTTGAEKKRIFLYHEAQGRYEEIPEEIVEAGALRFDSGTGYLIVTTEENDTLTMTAYTPEETDTPLRVLLRRESGNGVTLTVTDPALVTEDGKETVLLNMTSDDADRLEAAEELFRTRIIWQDVTNAPAEDETPPDDTQTPPDDVQTAPEDTQYAPDDMQEQTRLRLIVGQFYVPDLIAPYYKNRMYLLQDGGELLSVYEIPEADLIVRAEAATDAEGGMAVLLTFENEPQMTISLRELF